MVTLTGEVLTISLEPARGGEIREVRRHDGPNILFWADWEAPRPAAGGASYGSTTLDFLAGYRGGWQELLPNPGAECEVLGVPMAFHGDASNGPWEVVDLGREHVRLATATRLPLRVEKSVRLVGATLLVEERLTNVGELDVPYGWGHHPAFDALPGTRIDLPEGWLTTLPGLEGPLADLAPGREFRWPYAPGIDGAVTDLSVVGAGACERLSCLLEPEGWAALRRPDGVGVAMAWPPAVFRHLWLWHEIGGTGFPWFGRARIVALEPVGLWPPDGLAAAHERGDAPVLVQGASVDAWLSMTIFDCDEQPVVGVTSDGSIELGHPE